MPRGRPKKNRNIGIPVGEFPKSPLSLLTSEPILAPVEAEPLPEATDEMPVFGAVEHQPVNFDQNVSAPKSLYFVGKDLEQLERLLGRTLSESSEVIKYLTELESFQLEIGGGEFVGIHLTPTQKRRLQLAMYGGRTPEKFFKSILIEKLGA